MECRIFWDGLSSGREPPVTIVTPDPSTESPRRVAFLAPRGVPVVMSTGAWVHYGVIWAPWFVVLRDGVVVNAGHATTWEELDGLLTAAGPGNT